VGFFSHPASFNWLPTPLDSDLCRLLGLLLLLLSLALLLCLGRLLLYLQLLELEHLGVHLLL
jgi:hypothetical protein